MPLVIQRKAPKPDGNDPQAMWNWLIDILSKIYDALYGLFTLDAEVRAIRTVAAERAVLFTGVASAVLISFETLIPDTIVKDFTTAVINFDAGSGAGRYRYDGGIPSNVNAPTSGMVIPAGAFQLTIVGALNIRSFKAIGEGGATLNLSVTLHQ